jgi:hypothetical protein
MDYVVDVFDRGGLRVGRFTEVPLMEVTRNGTDGSDRIEGLLPVSLDHFGVGYEVRVSLGGTEVVSAPVIDVRPAWGDVRRLIVDRYVDFQELLAFVAEDEKDEADGHVSARFENQRIDDMVRRLINGALGPVHYTVEHGAYPEGAEREYAKFSQRKSESEPLPIGGIDSGQWVDSSRIDISGATAKDGDTISGLVVDGVAWPDLRLMMVDSEETGLNSHAIKRHPEVATWDSAQYDRSVYKRHADRAKEKLQSYMDTYGIDFIELNPHQDGSGTFDDRVDFFGRYLGMVYGGGLCYNAGLVEEGVADVFLFDEGRFHVPGMALKDFYSYVGAHEDSVKECTQVVGAFDARGGAIELIAALAAMGGGYVFHLDNKIALHFRRGEEIDQVIPVEPAHVGVELGRVSKGVVNSLRIQGNPTGAAVEVYRVEEASIDELGTVFRSLPYYALSRGDDAALLGDGLLKDLAWPGIVGRALFYRGRSDIDTGALLEFRGGPLRERDTGVAQAWETHFGDRFVGRVRQVLHRFAGGTVETRLALASPFRSVVSPLNFVIRGQDSLQAFFEFRLDDGAIGLDIGYHLD